MTAANQLNKVRQIIRQGGSIPAAFKRIWRKQDSNARDDKSQESMDNNDKKGGCSHSHSEDEGMNAAKSETFISAAEDQVELLRAGKTTKFKNRLNKLKDKLIVQ